MSFVTKLNSMRSTWFLVLLILFSFAFRFVVLPLSTIHGDEYCFATTAQGIIKGFLPYSYMFEHKPFGLYYFFSSFFYLIGDNIFALRIIAIFVVFISSLFILNFSSNKVISLFLVLVYNFTLIGSTPEGLASDSEIIVNMFVLGSIYYLFFSKKRFSYLVACIFMGLSISMNYLAIPIVFSLLLTKLIFYRSENLFYFVTGIIVVFFVNFIFYIPNYIQGDLTNVFLLQKTWLDTYRTPIIERINLKKFIITCLRYYPIFIIVGLLFLTSFSSFKQQILSINFKIINIKYFSNKLLLSSLIILSASFASFISTGQYWPHHFFVVLPALIFLCTVLINISSFDLVNRMIPFYVLLLISALFITVPRFSIWGLDAWNNVLNDKQPDATAELAVFLNKNTSKDETFFMYSARNEHQGLYFLSKKKPLTKIPLWNQVTHPPYQKAFLGHDALEEFKLILEKQPKFIVIDKNLNVELSVDKQDIFLNANLKNNYEQIENNFGIFLYRKISN